MLILPQILQFIAKIECYFAPLYYRGGEHLNSQYPQNLALHDRSRIILFLCSCSFSEGYIALLEILNIYFLTGVNLLFKTKLCFNELYFRVACVFSLL